MVEILTALVLGAIIAFLSFFKNREKVKNDFKKRIDLEKYLNGLEKFEIDLDTIKIDDFEFSENVEVDVYGNELTPTKVGLFSGNSRYSQKNKFHKRIDVTRFSSRIYVTFNYLDNEYQFVKNIPIEHTKIRMKFYLQKKTNIYIGKTENENSNSICFLFDFRFIKNSRNYLFSTELFPYKN